MEYGKVLLDIRKDILTHIEDNYHLLLDDKAKVTVLDYGEADSRRIAYLYKLHLGNGVWVDVSYNLLISIKPSK